MYSNHTVSRLVTYCVLVNFLQILVVVVIWCYASTWGKNNFYLRDVLRNLPDNLIDDILTRLPLWNVVRTSILSKKWNIIGIDFHNWNLIKHYGKQQRTRYHLIYILSRNDIQQLVLKPPFRIRHMNWLLHILHVHNWGICFWKTVKYVPLMSLRDWLVN